ncbi:hypothetical protein TNIN_259941 [Trichonephila inaurata madagascariensis]|uniref:Uncharacterized protein n=1 Tax=Trichonephila inaurata madagascariensis TaxID=2747483 RepID=A0A8X6WRD9_9ARAC|nr:hypothetical protein TNIN_259941 [Trichonephila inaurata madagascariensis]
MEILLGLRSKRSAMCCPRDPEFLCESESSRCIPLPFEMRQRRRYRNAGEEYITDESAYRLYFGNSNKELEKLP